MRETHLEFTENFQNQLILMPIEQVILKRYFSHVLTACAIVCALSSHCWAVEESATEIPTPAITANPPGALQKIRNKAADLTESAMSLIGIHYKRGGNLPENGLDCSGFVRYVFKDVLGADLPRTSAEISKVGENVEQKDLKPGDLVFFNTLRRGFSHVGIYLGDNKFIHSPAAGGQVRVESLDISYWKKRFNGARRINEKSEN